MFTQKAKLDYEIVIIIITFLIGSCLFFGVEPGLNPEVAIFEDSVWYTLVSMTPTSYEDILPVTSIGRIIGSFFNGNWSIICRIYNSFNCFNIY